MQIQLEIINRTGLEPGVPTRFTVSSASVTIGRGKKADWELPDASRFLSSAHCRILPAKGGFVIDVLSANGMVHNGKSLAQGDAARLADGDRLEIGPYLMLASLWLSDADTSDRTVVLRRRAEDAGGEKTVIQPRRSAAPATETPRAANLEPARPLVRPPAPGRPAALPAAGIELVRAFAAGAAIDPELLAGRTNLEFAGELGAAMRQAALGLGALARSAGELRALVGSRSPGHNSLTEETDGGGLLASLFAVAGSDYRRAGQAVGDLSDSLQAHDAAVFHAMQTALFRLLNELAPMSVEAGTGSGLLRSKKARNWDRYVKTWENLSFGRENGMFDAFLDYFRQAYDDRMSGH